MEYCDACGIPMAIGTQISASFDLEDVVDKPYKSLEDHCCTQVNDAGLTYCILLEQLVKSWQGHLRSNGTWVWMLCGT
jgi:hypothetical protein